MSESEPSKLGEEEVVLDKLVIEKSEDSVIDTNIIVKETITNTTLTGMFIN